MRVAVIGTAGRKGDADQLSWELYQRMVHATARHVSLEDDLQSGGAAYSDHIAVLLYLAGCARSLTLYLPERFDLHRACFGGPEHSGDGSVANYYHRSFSRRIGVPNTMENIRDAVTKGAQIVVVPGFKARNIPVGECDKLVAFTFGRGDRPRDGGTLHTWEHSTAGTKIHIPIASL